MRLLLIPLAAVLLSGCALFTKPAETVSFPRGEFALTYRDLSVAYALIEQQIVTGCKTKVINEETCESGARARERLAELDSEIRDAIANPAYEVNWKNVAKALRIISQLAVAVVPGAGPAVSGVLGAAEKAAEKKAAPQK
jgi:hypothetical protein